MEDQQPGPGDVTDEAPDADGPGPTEDAPAETVARPRRPAGRWVAVTAGISAVLFVGAAAFAGAAAQPYLADRALVATKLEIARAAADGVTALWNYTPENMDTLTDRAAAYLSGDLEADYRKFIETISAANKQAKVTDNTDIVGVAVESLDGSEATVLIYTNTTASSELEKTIPSLKYQSHRLSMKRLHNRWVITKMPTVTSLSLTPQL